MSRAGNYGSSKRERDAEKKRKKREKAQRRAQKREQGPSEPEIASAEEIAGDVPSVEEAMAAIEETGGTARAAEPVPCRLFVGGLSWDTDEASLRKAFSAYGNVLDAFVMTDRNTGRSRGFGFVTLEDRKDAAKAMDELDGAELDGRAIAVNLATKR